MTSVEHPESVAHKILKPLFFRFLHWYLENRQATHDLIVLFVLSIFTYFFIMRHDLMDGFYAYTRQHEELELDELVMTLGYDPGRGLFCLRFGLCPAPLGGSRKAFETSKYG